MAKYSAQTYSQNGEDGIIAEIFRRIGTHNRTFVEIGIESGQQNNTRLLIEAIVDITNVDDLLDRASIPMELDFLSLDIDYGTSHVWKALQRRVRVACIEYNAALPPSIALEVPHDPSGKWDGTNWFGASLKALERTGEEKLLHLVGCDLLGVNAFFVTQTEAKGQFRAPFTAETHWEPLRLQKLRHLGHPPSEQARRWIAL